MVLGSSMASARALRQARAAAGRTQPATLAWAAAELTPTAPTINLEDEPTVPPSPITGGDGLPPDEGAVDDPFTTDDPDLIVPEGVDGGASPGP